MSNTKELDPHRHFYLYAKGWYNRSGSILCDLSIIQGEYCGIDSSHISKYDISRMLIGLAYKHIENEHQFLDFLSHLNPSYCWWVGYLHKDSPTDMHGSYKEDEKLPYDFHLALIHSCLSILSLAEVRRFVEGEGYKDLLNLGEPDYSILPSGKENSDVAV